jgi:hypothetical protein
MQPHRALTSRSHQETTDLAKKRSTNHPCGEMAPLALTDKRNQV